VIGGVEKTAKQGASSLILFAVYSYTLNDQFKDDEMGGAYSTNKVEEELI
jgi:hypothetical protein